MFLTWNKKKRILCLSIYFDFQWGYNLYISCNTILSYGLEEGKEISKCNKIAFSDIIFKQVWVEDEKNY